MSGKKSVGKMSHKLQKIMKYQKILLPCRFEYGKRNDNRNSFDIKLSSNDFKIDSQF